MKRICCLICAMLLVASCAAVAEPTQNQAVSAPALIATIAPSAAPQETGAPETSIVPESAEATPAPTAEGATEEPATEPEATLEGEPTAEPSVEPTTEATEEQPEQPEETEDAEEKAPARSVSIEVRGGEAHKLGDEITLVAHVSGFEGTPYTLVWEYCDNARDEWKPAPGVNNASEYTFTYTEENQSWAWRVAVDF